MPCTFRSPIFFCTKTIQSQVRVKNVHSFHRTASSSSRRRVKATFCISPWRAPLCPHLKKVTLLPPEMGEFRTGKDYLQLWQKVKVNYLSQGPFCRDISDPNGRHYLLQLTAMGSLLRPCPLQPSRHSMALLYP